MSKHSQKSPLKERFSGSAVASGSFICTIPQNNIVNQLLSTGWNEKHHKVSTGMDRSK